MKSLSCFLLALSLALSGCSSTGSKSDSAGSHPGGIRVRDNAYSLLYQLLDEEKHVSKLLIIKRDSRELNHLINDISDASGKAADQLKQFNKQDVTLDLDALNLPPGEVATREAIATTKKKELLGNSGDAFERALLLTQIQALNYAAHLASVAATNDANNNRSAWLRSLSREMKEYYAQCVELLARTPHGR